MAEKTVKVRHENGGFVVEATNTGGYTKPPEIIQVVRMEASGTRVTARPALALLNSRKTHPDDGTIERTLATFQVAGSPPGTYEVTVQCSDQRFVNTVLVA